MKLKTSRVRLGDLVGAEYNPRTMPAVEMSKLKNSIREFGFVVPPVVRKADGMIIGGHQRVTALRELLREAGEDEEKISKHEVDVIVVDLDDDRAKVLNLALNKISGDWDYELLGSVLRSLGELEPAHIQLSGFSDREIEDILALSEPPNLEVGDAGDSGTEEMDEKLTRDNRRFVFVVDTEIQASMIRSALTTFGMTKPSEAAMAFIAIVQRAIEVGPVVEEKRVKRKRKATA